MENVFIESPAHRAQLFSALDRVTNLATESHQDAATALPEVAAPSIAPDAVVPLTEPASALSNAFAFVAALALAGVAAFFSIMGMVEVFPGAPTAVMVLAGSMEVSKLIIAGWLAANWSVARWELRMVLVALLTGLALINAAGVFGKLVEAHVAAAAFARTGVSERMEVVDARLTSQSATLADFDRRISQIDAAVDESTRRGQVGRAMALADQQRKTRDSLVASRQAAAATLIETKAQRAALAAERDRVEATAGPVQYLATAAGTNSETVVRWLILLMVLCCDPAAIALTIAVAGARSRNVVGQR
ncbi:hypothetical protein [Bradyrhizobium canariense]|uniref:Uncharacterized protein n=1 Tax=Bradyrhizobium canariense TaxID=255045 RepID=A0A1X3GDT2_9BRAD|nr:hypothetical protein [Bradyrhizobium canariense]OSI66351.1 hypothetical protein BSZ22_27920 [Bradyrhizobium canariense]OSI77739.1 hypothetical protein BSZ23_20710 [Bradyrhizobium canariense]OSI86710.1 hypothetical protein BSZ24_28600 [Bradyrhizobium canariense]OSI88897.1 hypothetical protein BSZ25_22180 [Bradyrhizobium canariense]OSJ01351.1 hypothetical protein BSZ16_19600 [Bradyrhizobium canariense]